MLGGSGEIIENIPYWLELLRHRPYKTMLIAIVLVSSILYKVMLSKGQFRLLFYYISILKTYALCKCVYRPLNLFSKLFANFHTRHKTTKVHPTALYQSLMGNNLE